MRPLTSFATVTQAEVVRARLVDEGIPAEVGDWSAMREIADYRILVPDEFLAEAAAILGIDPPVDPAPFPPWVNRLMVGVAVAMALFVAWALLVA
ncbi:MAG: hypothetical protein AB1Z57_09295 [Acidimicrobiia bacterium]